ncbi:aldehyde dehydrogenase (NADP(+)) [Labrenzia sp. PHM005]|nr:aldehyde dehydrogenase (NADP(+)) [Labrenzia sp. PHM005]
MTGRHLINGEWVRSDESFLSAPWQGQGHDVFVATADQVHEAASAAEAASEILYSTSGADRAALLERIADEIDARGEQITAIAHRETALPQARLEGERARTCGQLRMFAEFIRSGRHLETRIDQGDPSAVPPRPALKLEMRPIGPVAVFGASNFPLAFSVAGGDTASALAAGCPVIVKGHEAHPGTSEIVAEAVLAALRAEGLPEGCFALLQGPGRVTGVDLVRHPIIRAVGFTGSTSAGRALLDLCMARHEPIPFFGELGSLNPVFVLSGALADRTDQIAQEWVASMTLGAGQFCTSPSVVFVPEQFLTSFVDAAASALKSVTQQPMLTTGIADSFSEKSGSAASRPGVETVFVGPSSKRSFAAMVLSCDLDTWLADESLREEVFGPMAIIVSVSKQERMIETAARLDGQLTATLHFEPSDGSLACALLPILERKAGRILANGFPTGVAVSDAMVHGGPWPASSNFGQTAVGTLAIRRWQRAVCWQGIPDFLL